VERYIHIEIHYWLDIVTIYNKLSAAWRVEILKIRRDRKFEIMTYEFLIKKHLRKAIILMIALTYTSLVIPKLFLGYQKVKTEVDIQDGLFITESGLLPLPENAVELEKIFTIPSSHFREVQKITQDSSGNIYVSDSSTSAVFKFNPYGKLLNRIEGKGKGKLLKPNLIFAAQDDLYIHDLEKEAIFCLDLEGNYINKLKISSLDDFTFDPNGHLYVAPTVIDQNIPLVQVRSLKEHSIKSFGKPVSYRHSMGVLNSRTLAVDSQGELWVAFTYFPIVRKYSKQGDLISEFKIDNLIMKAKEQYNLKKIGRGIAQSSQRMGYMEVIKDIEAHGDKIYLLSYYPRLEITELKQNGEIGKTYWKEFLEVYKTKGFVIQEKEGELRFMVLRSDHPNYSVDVFKEAEKDQLSPFERALKKHTETIKINPNYWRAYYSRALIKYDHKDFKGAVEDFNKVIELDLKNVSAFYNRGNCWVNLGQYDKAIQGFTKAIEINPQHATAYYNRGIALMYKKDFDEAIKDFKKAAELDPNLRNKAWQKIN